MSVSISALTAVRALCIATCTWQAARTTKDVANDKTECALSLQIKQLLPRLGESGFIISPSQAQLAMMVREGGPAALRQVANFSVQHKVHGSIKWLEPVDVSALRLADLVVISRNNVDVGITPDGTIKHASNHRIYPTACMTHI